MLNLIKTAIREVKDLITNADLVDIADSFAIKLLGVRLTIAGLLVRDFGTKCKFANLPTGTLQDSFPLYDPNTGSTHEVVVSVDSGSKTRIWVDTSTGATGTFEDLTKYWTATVNGDPTTTCQLSNLSEAITTNSLAGYIAVNNTRKVSEIKITSVTNPSSTTVRINLPVGHGLTMEHTVCVNGVEGVWVANGMFRVSAFDTTYVELLGAVFSGTYTANTGTISGLGSVVTILSNTTSGFTAANEMGTAGLQWLTSDNITIYKSVGAYLHTYSNGTSPQLNWLPVESQRKVALLNGNSDTIPTMNYPVSIQKKDARNYFPTSATAYLKTLPAGWYLERRGGLCPFYKQIGAVSSSLSTYVHGTGILVPILTTNARTVFVSDEDTGLPWLGIETAVSDIVVSPVATGHKTRLFVCVTAMYGYQESDPIFQAICSSSSDNYQTISAQLTFHINHSLMDKEITSFKIYTVPFLTTDVDGGRELLTADNDYRATKELFVQNTFDQAVVWTTDTSSNMALYGGFLNYAAITVTTNDALNAKGKDSLVKSLGHGRQTTQRTRKKPRYGIHTAREQIAATVIDGDDRTLFVSASGGGVNMDDNFLSIETDAQGQRMKLDLIGRGELMGLGLQDGDIIAIRRSEAHVIDVFSNITRMIHCDCASKKGILIHPLGTMIAGETGIWLLPNGGGRAHRLNPKWLNKYDGTLKVPGTTTSYVTSTYRSQILAGYDPKFGDAWFQIEMNVAGGGTEFINMRFFPPDPTTNESGKWCERKLPSQVKWMRKWFDEASLDKTMTLGTAAKILMYPNIDGGDLTYEDEVTSAGVSAGYGIAYDVWLHLGSYYDFLDGNILYGVQFDHVGESVNGTGVYTISFYKNRETTAYDTFGQYVDSRCEVRGVARVGAIRDVQLRITLPSDTLTNFKKFDISTIYLIGEKKSVMPVLQ